MCRNRCLAIMTSVLLVFMSLVIFGSAAAYAQVPSLVRVGLITANSGSTYRNATEISFSTQGSYNVVDLAAIPGENIVGTPVDSDKWQMFYLPTGIQIYKNGQALRITSGPVVVREVSHADVNRVSLDSCTIGGNYKSIARYYRGDMEFRSGVGCVVAINELPLEEYLYGVVPREVGNGWPAEVLKAQAVAARTYVAGNYNKHAVEGFNMLDTTADQVYGGLNSEGANATKAVQETAGKVIIYNGQPIDAKYHSTSGGHTEDNENVWGGEPRAYLRGKDDPYSTQRSLANWTFTTTIEDVRNKLVQAGSQIGPITSIQLEKYPSGRVKTVIIKDINGNTITKSGSVFGKMFNPGFSHDRNLDNTLRFMSNFFDVKMESVTNPSYSVINGQGVVSSQAGAGLYGVADDDRVEQLNGSSASFYALGAGGAATLNKAATGSVVFPGHGWGHGVGMSQWGAYEMASQGKSYTDILKFYYTGVEITDTY